MACLFIYWIKYVYVEKDEKDMKGYSPLSQNIHSLPIAFVFQLL